MRGVSWSRNELENALLFLLGVSVRLAWLYPLAQGILWATWVNPSDTSFSLFLVLALLICATALGRVLRATAAGPLIAAVVGLLASLAVAIGVTWTTQGWTVWLGRLRSGLITLEGGLPASLVALFAAVGIWRVGLRAKWLDHDDLWRDFRLGLLFLAILMLSMGTRLHAKGLDITLYLVWLLGSGLVTLALLSSRMAGASLRDQVPLQVSRSWSLAVTCIVLGVLGASWLLGEIFSPKAVAKIVEVLSPIIGIAGRVLRLILMALAYVVFWVLTPLIEALRAATDRGEDPLKDMRTAAVRDPWRIQTETAAWPPLVRTLLVVMVAIGLLGGILLILWAAWRSSERRAGNSPPTQDVRESIWSKELIGQQIASLRKHWRRSPPFLALDREEGARSAVRRLYQLLLIETARLGLARDPACTPLGYQQLLSGAFPAHTKAIETMTRTYLMARYAASQLSQQDVLVARQAWRELSAALRNQRRMR